MPWQGQYQSLKLYDEKSLFLRDVNAVYSEGIVMMRDFTCEFSRRLRVNLLLSSVECMLLNFRSASNWIQLDTFTLSTVSKSVIYNRNPQYLQWQIIKISANASVCIHSICFKTAPPNGRSRISRRNFSFFLVKGSLVTRPITTSLRSRSGIGYGLNKSWVDLRQTFELPQT